MVTRVGAGAAEMQVPPRSRCRRRRDASAGEKSVQVPPSRRCRCRQEVAAGAALVVRKLVVVIQVALVELLQTSRRAEVGTRGSRR